jgi:hypothetical protein
MSEDNFIEKVIKKVKGAIPISNTPCIVAVHRHTMLPNDFKARYGMTKEEMPNCSPIDHADPDFHDFSESSYSPPPYISTPGFDKPQSEVAITHARSVITTCVAHADLLGDSVMKRLIKLHGLRRQLNPGESPSTQRLFDKWTQLRNDRVMEKKRRVEQKQRKNDAARRNAPKRPEREVIGEEGLQYWGGDDASKINKFDVRDLLALHKGWDAPTEENEPDSNDANFSFDEPEDEE